MMSVDLLHEFELGVWKALFAHLIRMLESLGMEKIQEFDARYVFHSYERTHVEIDANVSSGFE